MNDGRTRWPLPRHVDQQAFAQRLDRFQIETPVVGLRGHRHALRQVPAGRRRPHHRRETSPTPPRSTNSPAAARASPSTCSGTSAPTPNRRRSAPAPRKLGVRIGAINPNVFQDQCYKYGSLANRDPEIRQRALQHIRDSIEIGRAVGSDLLSLWFADGTNYPGQASIRRAQTAGSR